jgi:hypothetical protein
MIRSLVSTQRGTTRESRTMSSHVGDCLEPGDAPWQRGQGVMPVLPLWVG